MNKNGKVSEAIKRSITDSCLRFDGNLTKMSADLGVGRSTLYRMIVNYGLTDRIKTLRESIKADKGE